MYIKRAITRRDGPNAPYFTYRLLRSVWSGDKVRKELVFTLGSQFSIERQYWRLLCQRIDELLKGTRTFMPLDCPAHVDECHAALSRFGYVDEAS